MVRDKYIHPHFIYPRPIRPEVSTRYDQYNTSQGASHCRKKLLPFIRVG